MTAAVETRFGINTQDLWYASRGTGLVLLVLLSAAVVIGVVVRSGWTPGRTLRFVVEALHKNLALLCVVLLVIHVVTAELDPYVVIGWAAAIVPFVSPYERLWIGLGAVSLDVFGAIIISSLLRRFIGVRLWRAVHLIAYLSWPVAFVHSLEASSDHTITWVAVLMWSCLAAVVASAAVRIVAERPGGKWSRRAVEQLTPAPVTVTVGAARTTSDGRVLDPTGGRR